MQTKSLRMAMKIVVPAAFVVVFGWLLFTASRGAPAYHGKPLRFWLELLLAKNPPLPGHSFTQDYKMASEAVKSIGTNAIPTLLAMLRTTNSQSRLELGRLTPPSELIRIRRIPAGDLNAQAAFGFQCLGEKAESAVSAIIRIYEARMSAASEQWASYALGAIGPAARQAVPALLRGATNSNPQRRMHSLIALAGMHAEPEATVAALTNAFRDPDPEVRLWACNRFGLLGTEARDARTNASAALEALFQDSDPRVRREAAAVAMKVRPLR
jgi:hypothetical protein